MVEYSSDKRKVGSSTLPKPIYFLSKVELNNTWFMETKIFNNKDGVTNSKMNLVVLHP